MFNNVAHKIIFITVGFIIITEAHNKSIQCRIITKTNNYLTIFLIKAIIASHHYIIHVQQVNKIIKIASAAANLFHG